MGKWTFLTQMRVLLSGLLAASAVATLTGCPAECTHDSDCQKKNTSTQTFVCINNTCRDFIFDGGFDAGLPDGGDAGQVGDAGQDGGFTPFVASLNAAQEIPDSGVTSTGTGNVQLFNLADGGFNFAFTVTHTVATPTLLELRSSPGATNGPLIAVLSSDAGSPVAGAMALTPAQAAELDRGLLYLNLDSTDHPDGSIRGQLLHPGEVLYLTRLQGFEGTGNTTDGGIQLILKTDGGLKFDGVWSEHAGAKVCVSAQSVGEVVCTPTTGGGFAVTGDVSPPPGINQTTLDLEVAANGLQTIVRDSTDAGVLSGTVFKP